MKLKYLLILILLVCTGAFLFYKGFINREVKKFAVDPLEIRVQQQPEYFPVIMNEVPQGFINLNTALELSKEQVNTFFFETNFVMQNSKSVTIFQTNVKNSNFIVIYNNEYYINEAEFLEITG